MVYMGRYAGSGAVVPRPMLSSRQRYGSRWTSGGNSSSSWCTNLTSARSSISAMAPGTSAMLRARRRDVNVKPNRRLDRSSTRGMIYENEELRLRTININAEVERSQDDIKKLRRENDQLRRELWGLRDEYDKLEALLKRKRQHGDDESEEYSDEDDDGEGRDDGEERSYDEEEEEEKDEVQAASGAGGSTQPVTSAADSSANQASTTSATFRDRQVDFDMLSVVQEETEGDQTDSQGTGGEEQTASPGPPRKKGVCFQLEHKQDQYLIGADGKPLRGAAGQFLTMSDLAKSGGPFNQIAAYGYATGTVVGGVLIPALDPISGVPITGLLQSPCGSELYLADAPDGDAAPEASKPCDGAEYPPPTGFDGLLQQAEGEDVWQVRDPLMQPRGAPDVFVEGAYPLGEPGQSGSLDHLLQNVHLGDGQMPASITSQEDAQQDVEDQGEGCGGVIVALRGVPASVPDKEVLAALSQLGTIVGGVWRLGGPGDGAAGDGDPGGGGGERLARLLPRGQVQELPSHLGVAGVLADVRVLSEQLDLSEFEPRSEEMRDKALRSSSVPNCKPFRSQIQVRLRSPGRGGAGPRAALAPSPPPARHPGQAGAPALAPRGRPLPLGAAMPAGPGAGGPRLAADQIGRFKAPGLAAPSLPATSASYHAMPLRRPSTPYPGTIALPALLPRAPFPGARPGPVGGPLSAVRPCGPGADPSAVNRMALPSDSEVVAVVTAAPATAPATIPVLVPVGAANPLLVPTSAVSLATHPGEALPALPPSSAPGTPVPVHRHVLGPQGHENHSGSETHLDHAAGGGAPSASPSASPALGRRPVKRVLQRKTSAGSTPTQLEAETPNGTALGASPGVRRKNTKHKSAAQVSDPSPPMSAGVGGTPMGAKVRPHAGDVSQSSSSGQESPNKSERRRRVSILSRKPRRPPSPPDDTILLDHMTTASERERTNSASSRDSRVSNWNISSQRRRLSSIRRDSTDSGKVPWCGCWGNGCL